MLELLNGLVLFSEVSTRTSGRMTRLNGFGTVGGGSTTYGALTVGMNLKPTIPKPFSLVIRPEVRVDTSLNNTRPFNNSSNRSMVTAGLDFILTF